MEISPDSLITRTERLFIRHLTEADIPALASLWTDPEVTRFMGGPRDFEKVSGSFKEDLLSPPPKLDLWPVIERASGEVVGHCGLLPKTVDGQDEIELVYLMATAFQGRGFATEAALALLGHAFQKLGLTRLVSLIDPANTASERVASKAGMKHSTDTVRPGGKTLRVYSTR